jgi:alcohol dehydrogenase class IV
MAESAGSETAVFFGNFRARKLATDIAGRAAPDARVFLITDRTLHQAGILGDVYDALGETSLHLTVYDGIEGEPNAAEIDAATARAVDCKADLILAVGGGSVLDVAKFVAALVPDAAPVAPCALAERPFPAARLPLVAIPTTAGTGAEVTRTSIFALDDGTKVWAWDRRLNPDVAILDPVMTQSLSPGLTVTTGVDALVHAIEATTNRSTGPGIDLPAMSAISLVRAYLGRALASPADLRARGAMLQAACLAGKSIDKGGTGVAHAIGHALGSLGGVPHGRAVGTGLRAALDWNAEGAPAAHAAVADAFGVPAPVDASDEARAVALGRAFDDFLDRVSMPRDLSDHGLGPRDVDRVAEAVLWRENAAMRDSNCRKVDAAAALLLSKRLLTPAEERAGAHG